MNKETKEEYLETLYKLSLESEDRKVKTGEIAEDLSVSSPSVTEILPKLEEEGYVVYRPYHGVELTGKGRKEGRKIVRTHRVLEVFLDQFFDISDDKMHEKACELEHIFDMEMIDEICERMDAPSVCPHGNKIPSCARNDCPLDGKS